MAVAPTFSMLLVFLLFGTGISLPLGVPPLPEDPALLKAAPPETLLLLEWFGSADPDPASGNATEGLAAEPEVRALISRLKDAIRTGIEREAPRDARVLLRDGLDLLDIAIGRPGCLFVSGVDLPPAPPSIRAGIVLNVAGKTAAVERSLSNLESFLLREMSRGGGAPAVETIEVEGAKLRALPVPPPVPPIAWGFSGDHLVIAIGEGMPGQIIGNLSKGPGLAGSEAFRKLQGRVKVERPCSRTYIDIAGILEKVRTAGIMPPPAERALDALGLTSMTAVVTEGGLDGPGFLSKTFVATSGKPRGFLGLAGGRPLGDEDLAVIPRDATIAAAFRLDAAAIYREFLATIGEIDGRAREEFAREVEDGFRRNLGIRISEDILEPLGDAWRIWSAPSQGGLIFTGATLAVDVKDRARLEGTIDRIVEVLRREMGPRDGSRGGRGVRIDSFVHKGTKVHFLNAIGGEIPVAPAWCLTDRQLLFSLYPQMLKAAIDRGPDPKTSIAAHPALAGRGEAMAVTFVDVPEIFRLAYPLLHPLAAIAAGQIQREGVDLTAALLPSAAAILPHLSAEVTTVARTGDGILSVQRGSLPAFGGVAAALPVLGMPLLYFRAAAAPPPQRMPTAPADAQPAPPGEEPAEPPAVQAPEPKKAEPKKKASRKKRPE